jgi:Flp pilus assembly protein protease CpaA
MLVGIGVDRVYGFWVQVVAGLTIGGALLTFWHSSDLDWILVALASCVYVLIASGLGRSSYAVLAAIGLFLTTTHFVLKWFGPKDVGFFSASEPGRPWAAALSYSVYGLVLMLIGLWLARRWPPAEPL